MIVFFTLLINAYAFMIFWKLADVKLDGISLVRKVGGISLLAASEIASAIFLQYQDLMAYGMYYPLLVQLPSYLAFMLLARFRGIKLFFTFLTAVFLTSPVTMVVMAIKSFSLVPPVVDGLFILLALALCAFLVLRFFAPMYQYILRSMNSGFWLFCLLPGFGYVFYYLTSGYYYENANTIGILQLRFALSFSTLMAYLFIYLLYKRNREIGIARNQAAILEESTAASLSQFNQMRETFQQTKILHHDMRHHLGLIQSYLQAGNTAGLQDYVNQIDQQINAQTIPEYCEHTAANLILSAYAEKCSAAGINFQVKADIPAETTVSDSDMCTLLSNALENAVIENSHGGDSERYIQLHCHRKNGKHHLMIANPCFRRAAFHKGLPVSVEAGHGHGVPSMVAVIANYGGIYSFKVENEVFIFSAMF